MKHKFTLFFALLILIKFNAQVVLNESFTAPFSPSAAGWIIKNNSVPTGTNTWFQGNPNFLLANSGTPPDYVGVDYNSQGSTAGGISNFLITPTVNLTNGAVFEFVTSAIPNITYPDRLQVLMSLGSGTGAIGSGTTAVGTFTTLLTDINPGLTANGYPTVWTVYSITLTGVTNSVGRFAFRYFVADGGPNGTNSNYIGIDDVKYTLPPCITPTINITPSSSTICLGASVNLSGSGANSYTWNTGATSSTINVTPNTTTIYTLTGLSTPGCSSTGTTMVTVVATPTISANSTSICPNATTTLTASGASTYSWSTGANGSSITVSPSSNTNYTVTGSNGTCSSSTVISVSVVGALVISVADASICPNGTATLTANGASTYIWSTGENGASIVVSPNTNTTYTVTGQSGNCSGNTTVSVTIVANPTLAVSNVTICPNTYTTLTASGASTYSWNTGATSASLLVAPSSNTNYTVTGSNGPGCTNTKTLSVTVSTVMAVADVTACPNMPVTLVATGALIYNWSTGATTSSIIITPTANVTYTLTGNNGTCSETKTVGVTINPNLSVSNVTTCAGTAATLTANGATSYTWNTGSNSNLIVVTPTANTNYTVIGGNGTCSDTKTVSVTIGTNLSVNASGVCVGTTLILTASGASSYTWLPSGGNAPSIIVTPTISSTYTVNGASGNCLGTQTVLASYCAGIENNAILSNNQMLIYPNPFTNELTISGANGHIQIINILGQVVLTTAISELETITTENFTPGIYFVRIINDKNMIEKTIKAIKN